MDKNEKFILGLDVSTTTIGIALFSEKNGVLDLKLLTHVSPKVKVKNISKDKERYLKIDIFIEEFLSKYKDLGISEVIIEEPLLQSNNIHTVGTLLKFNGILSYHVDKMLGVTPNFISSYDSRKYAFPELMAVRTMNRKGENLTEKQIAKNKPVLFGAYDFDVDKKAIIWDKVAELYPKIDWLYDKRGFLKKECYDMTDAVACVLGYKNMQKNG
jgi:hypothetical protein